MQMLVSIPDVETILSELSDEMTTAQFRAVHRLAALGITVNGRVADELDVEGRELRDWVDRVRAAVGVSTANMAAAGAMAHFMPENSPDRP
jgi:hypothetical protein